jgi:pimeloyl-ACP methyl ester carboxylesterase
MNDSHVMSLSDGRDLGWLELGNPDGWPIFGFHGTPGSRLQMAINEDAVRTAGVRLIAPDRPGYGMSSFQPNRRLVDWPSDVVELADHLGIDRFSVVGVSGGGPHAAVCAARLADRVVTAGIVSGVGPLANSRFAVGSNTGVRVLTALSRRQSRLVRVLTGAQVEAVRRWPTKAIALMMKQLPPSDVDILNRPELIALFERDARSASRTTGRAQAQDFELFASDWGFEFGEITVPVTLWQGDADKNVPPQHAHLMHEFISNSVLHTFAGEGHFLVIPRLEEILVALTPS